MKQGFYEKYAAQLPVQQPVQQLGADVATKVLPSGKSQLSIYEAAILAVKLKASAKLAVSDDRILSLDAAEASEEQAALDAVEPSEQAAADAETVLLAANHTAQPAAGGSQKPAASTAGAMSHAGDEGGHWGYMLPAFLLGAVAGAAGGKDDAASPQQPAVDHCEIDFTFPDKPTGATVQSIDVAALGNEVQASGDTFQLADGESLVVDVGANGRISGFAGNYLVAASGDMGDLYINASNNASAFLQVDVAGGVGDIAVRYGNDTEYDVSSYVSAYGDVGKVSLYASGAEAGGYFYLDTTGGNVGGVDMVFANPEGYGNAYVSAYAAVSGSALVGGSVGNVRLVAEGPTSDVNLYVMADGGDVGTLEAIACGGSASGDLYVSAYAQIDGNGLAVGGDVGDVTVVATGGSADMDVDVYAYGILSTSGQYLGGGNIGNVQVAVTGGSAESTSDLYAYSGGSIGTISIQTSNADENTYSASADVNAYAYGAGGQVATIGDVTMDVYGGIDNSAYVNLNAYSGGDIGTITATVTGGYSGQTDIYASAYANASGLGGNVGAVTLTDTSWAGDHSIDLTADTSIGAVTATLGGGSANLRMDIQAGQDATVGDISVTFDAQHYGSGGNLYLALDTGVTAGTITVTGGSELSSFSITANDIDQWWFGSSKVAGDIDMSGFAGFSDIDLYTVTEGVSIEVGQGGSSVLGSLGADTIVLGAGSDTVDFANFDFGTTPVDTITGFDAVADLEDTTDVLDVLNVFSAGGTFHELTSNTATTLADNDVVSLVDLSSGQDLSTASGLETALNSGEYALVDGDGFVSEYTFVTASGTSATSFNLFHVVNDGTSFNVDLMGSVTMAAGSTFTDLTSSNFIA